MFSVADRLLVLVVLGTVAERATANRQEISRLRMLVKTGMVLNAKLSLPAVLQRIANMACKLVGAQYGPSASWTEKGVSVSSSRQASTRTPRERSAPYRSGRVRFNAMGPVLLSLLLTLRDWFRPRAVLQAEVLALRHRLLVLRRSSRPRLRLHAADWL